MGSTAIDGDRPYESRFYVWFIQRHERDPLLKKTGDEISILYQNVHWKRTWFKDNRSLTVTEPGLHLKKILLSIWWVCKNIIYEFLSRGEIINFGKYYNQFDKLKNVIAEKIAKIGKLKRSSRQCKTPCCTVREKLLQIDWDVLSYIPQILLYPLLLVPVREIFYK